MKKVIKSLTTSMNKAFRRTVSHKITRLLGSTTLTVLIVVIASELITKNNVALGAYMILTQVMQKIELVAQGEDEAAETVVHITSHNGGHH